MKTKTMKKMLSLFLAVLMIALAIPFTLLTVGAEDLDGTLLKTVDFSDSAMWGTGYGSNTFSYADWEIMDNGASAKITLKNAGNKRVLWGGLQGDNDIEWTNADKRTVVFKALFGNQNFYFGIQMD